MNFKNKVLLISLLGVIALWHCRNGTTPGDTTPVASGNPDLIVEISANRTNALPSDEVTLKATVTNVGGLTSPETTLNWYFSADASLDTDTDTSLETEKINSLTAGEGRTVSIPILVSDVLGSYYYFTCVDAVTDEMNTNNNCSSVVMVVVLAPVPDLRVISITASNASVATSATLTLTAMVMNNGGATGDTPTLTWYRSDDSSLDTNADRSLGTEMVNALGAGDSQTLTNDMITAPMTAGTYHYFACVAPVTDETSTGNNCSPGEMVEVTAPDLTVQVMPASATVESSGMLTLTAMVRNTGRRASSAITLRWYSSADAAVDTGDTQLGNDVSVRSVAAGAGSSSVSNTITVPSGSGTYHYGACVVQVNPNEMDESDTTNNCFTVSVTVTVAPDLVVGVSPASTSVVTSGMLTLTATVENEGTRASDAATDLTWYRSDDNSLETDTDTQEATQEDEVGILTRAGNTGNSETISYMVTVPNTAGTYFYFVCVASVTNESNTDNNCSTAAEVIVGTSDFTVRITTASSINLEGGGTTTLTAVVSNVGNISGMGTLRWYSSTDGTISTTDTKVGTDVSVSDLAADATSGMLSSGALTVSMTAGTYYYGACIIDVTNETNTANNCSLAVAVVVSTASGGNRLANIEFTTLVTAGNNTPSGIWSDNETLWVSDDDDAKLYAYNLATRARDPDKDFDLARNPGTPTQDNRDSEGIWSNGTTMWVANNPGFVNGGDKIFAYKMSDKSRDPAKDFDTLTAASHNDLGDIWSDGDTLWVQNASDGLFAYDLESKARDSDKDITLHSSHTRPTGIWSDGVTIWVGQNSNSTDDEILAYVLATGARDGDKDFTLATQDDIPTALWSDGVTLWVATNSTNNDRVYAYDIRSLVTP